MYFRGYSIFYDGRCGVIFRGGGGGVTKTQKFSTFSFHRVKGEIFGRGTKMNSEIRNNLVTHDQFRIHDPSGVFNFLW